MKKVAGTLKISLAQYCDMQAFAMFASDLDRRPSFGSFRARCAPDGTAAPAWYSPMPMDERVAVIWAGTTSQLDEVPVEDVQRFETEFLDHATQLQPVAEAISRPGNWTTTALRLAESQMLQFKSTFRTSAGLLLDQVVADQVTPEGHPPAADRRQNRG